MNEIISFSSGLEDDLSEICETLRAFLDENIEANKSKLFHGAPVWFIDDNPIVGYSKKKKGIALLFWSGQSFKESGLTKVGKYKAAEIIYAKKAEIDLNKLKIWVKESQAIIWNYKDIRKNNGALFLVS